MLEYIQQPPLHGAGLSLSISIFSNIYYGNTIRKAIAEGVLCSSITLGLVGSLEFFYFPQSLSPGLGVSVGLLGYDKVKSLANCFFSNKIKNHMKVHNVTKSD